MLCPILFRAKRLALKYETKKHLRKSPDSWVYGWARTYGFTKQVFSHMPERNNKGVNSHSYKWTDEAIINKAKQYKFLSEFMRENYGMHDSAKKRGLLPILKQNMGTKSHRMKYRPKWTLDKIISVFSKYEFYGDAYKELPGIKRAFLKLSPKDKQIVLNISGAEIGLTRYTDEELFAIAKTFKTKTDFYKHQPNICGYLQTRGIYREATSHMKKSGSAIFEESIGNFAKLYCKNLIYRVRFKNDHWPEKPHIKRMEIDIFFPDINAGIECDGTVYHSYEWLSKSKKTWPQEDIVNYHPIKDEFFSKKGIKILHITEDEWYKNNLAAKIKIQMFMEGIIHGD